jgi:hypothetical protein
MIEIVKEPVRWKKILENVDHDWYHTWDSHQISKDNGEGDPLLFVYTVDDITICLPLILRSIDENWQDATSVYGYPGVLASVNVNENALTSFMDNLKEWGLSSNIVSIFSRLNPCIKTDLSVLDCYMKSSGKTVVIDLRLTLEDQRKKYRKNYRNLINKLDRDGFKCSWCNSDDDIEDFMRIYNGTMNTLSAGDNYYFDRSYYDSLIQSKDFNVRIYSCYHEGEKVCSGLFVFCNGIVQYHLSGTVEKFKVAAPTRLMIDCVRIDATGMGFIFFHLGGGLGGNEDGLYNFKFGFSKESIDFNILKIITNKLKYEELSNFSLNEIDINTSDFFPLYRKK